MSMRLSIVAMISIAVAACGELTVYETPYAQGTVIDASNGRPIAAALIAVKTRADVTVVTSASGEFVLSSASHRASSFLPWDTYPPAGAIVVSARGYEQQEVGLRGGINDVTIRLVPKQ